MSSNTAGWIERQCAGRTRFASRKLTLERLARHVDHAGFVRGIGKRELAGQTCVGTRQAVYNVRSLEAAGLVSSTPQFGPRGQQLTNAYRLLPEWVQSMIEGEQRAAQLGAELPTENRSAPRLGIFGFPIDESELAPDPPPRTRTRTYNASAAADYWRELNKTRW